MEILITAIGFYVWLNIIVLSRAVRIIKRIRTEALTGVCRLDKTVYFF